MGKDASVRIEAVAPALCIGYQFGSNWTVLGATQHIADSEGWRNIPRPYTDIFVCCLLDPDVNSIVNVWQNEITECDSRN